MNDSLKYLTLLPQLIMDPQILNYMGFNPETNQSECILKKEHGELWLHAAVYSLLEENEVMDDLMDILIEEKLFHKIVIFDNQEHSIIRLDY